jgi:hypothetical protein
MNFWIRNIVLGIILSVLAYAFITNQDFLLSLGGSADQVSKKEKSPSPSPKNAVTPKSFPTPAPIKKKSDTVKAKPKVKKPKSSNSAADGLSRMYSNLHGDMMGKNGPQIRNNIVYLPPLQGNITNILKAREMMVRPYKEDWIGSNDSRRFKKGDILTQRLIEYTEKEDIKLLWWLEKDFIVRHPFRVDKNLLVTVYQSAKSIEGHFPSGLSIFFCPKQRSIAVVESGPHKFLDRECMLLKPEKPAKS